MFSGMACTGVVRLSRGEGAWTVSRVCFERVLALGGAHARSMDGTAVEYTSRILVGAGGRRARLRARATRAQALEGWGARRRARGPGGWTTIVRLRSYTSLDS